MLLEVRKQLPSIDGALLFSIGSLPLCIYFTIPKIQSFDVEFFFVNECVCFNFILFFHFFFSLIPSSFGCNFKRCKFCPGTSVW